MSTSTATRYTVFQFLILGYCRTVRSVVKGEWKTFNSSF